MSLTTTTSPEPMYEEDEEMDFNKDCAAGVHDRRSILSSPDPYSEFSLREQGSYNTIFWALSWENVSAIVAAFADKLMLCAFVCF